MMNLIVSIAELPNNTNFSGNLRTFAEFKVTLLKPEEIAACPQPQKQPDHLSKLEISTSSSSFQQTNIRFFQITMITRKQTARNIRT
jgi:hypothetical protein